MNKIRLLTDTTCDIPVSTAEALGIELVHIPIAIGGKGYHEQVDFTTQEFYDILLTAPEVPVTARINAADYLEVFRRCAEEGVEDLITVTINAKGSGTHESAHMALEQFQKKEPTLSAGMRVHILDSRSYSLGYGWGLLEASRRIRAGDSAQEVLAYLRDWIDCVSIYLGCYSLDFAKKSGRINSTAAFVGELLGLRPIIRLRDGGNDVVEKVRGDKNVVNTLCDLACKTLAPKGEYIIVRGMLDEPAKELAEKMTERVGYPPAGEYNIGASVSINAGPKVVAIVFREQNRYR